MGNEGGNRWDDEDLELPEGFIEECMEMELPELHKLALQLPYNFVDIIYKGIEEGKTSEEIDQDVKEASKREQESN
tara:strand:+ start:277 stop:504 length:228 start_codon:yes stop_codon:yes gene_type:complete